MLVVVVAYLQVVVAAAEISHIKYNPCLQGRQKHLERIENKKGKKIFQNTYGNRTQYETYILRTYGNTKIKHLRILVQTRIIVNLQTFCDVVFLALGSTAGRS